MDIKDIINAAKYFEKSFLESFYIVVTYNGNGFILIAEKENFPHLMGIQKKTYNSNGYNKPQRLFNDLINGKEISKKIIPRKISSSSKMYLKVNNFTDNKSILLNNKCPIIVKYQPDKNNSKLNNVDLLIQDLYKGYMLGWIYNKDVPINNTISISKYCISSWIDESSGSQMQKEKYLPNQDVELIRYVLEFDKNSELKRRKEYKYSKIQKINILDACYRNNCNLSIDKQNAKTYITLAKNNNILCSINNTIYSE